MAKGDFVWCDLSTFRLDEAKRFYAKLLGWSFTEITQPDGTPYDIASTADGESAGLFVMPERFQALGLPSFWMSYIAVDDVDGAVETARSFGGKVELGPQPFDDEGAIALIRDPLGAGFTVYQGAALTPRMKEPAPGHMAWNALFVSDSDAVMAFYASLFDWRIARDTDASCIICNAHGEEIAAIYEQDEETRGGYQYWGVHFAVRDVAAAKATIVELGGTVLAEERAECGPVLAVQDLDGAAFYLVPA